MRRIAARTTVADGAAVALLQGADCDRSIAGFAARVPLDQGATVRWRRMAKALRDPSPHARAVAIEAGDVESLVLRMSLGLPVVAHPRIALPRMKEGLALAADGTRVGYAKAIWFNGERIRGANGGFRFEISSPLKGLFWHATGVRGHAYPSGRWWAEDVPDGNAIAAADSGEIRVAVGGIVGAGYLLAVSRDGGRRWERSVIAPGKRLIEIDQEWSSGDIDILVADSEAMYRHSISPSGIRDPVSSS